MVMTLWGYTALVAVVGAERLLELWLSRRNAAAAFARGGQEFGQAHYPVMASFHAAFLVACVAEPWLLDRPFPGAVGWVALALVVAAQALRYWAIATLGWRWNTRVIVVPGLSPVGGGPYRFLRHPNYLAVVVELAALPLVHGGWLTAVVASLLNAAILSVRIPVEEAALGLRPARR